MGIILRASAKVKKKVEEQDIYMGTHSPGETKRKVGSY